MTTQQSSIRFTTKTRQQLDALAAAGWGTQTNIVATAIDRMFQQEMKGDDELTEEELATLKMKLGVLEELKKGKNMNISYNNSTDAAIVDRIANSVVENGRVEGEGDAWIESLRNEVEFEATEQGYSSEDAAAIADAAIDRYRIA